MVAKKPKWHDEVLRFAERVKQPRSKLGLFEDQVFELIALGVSFRQIAAFLAERGVDTGPGEVFRFVSRKSRGARLSAAKSRADALSAPAPSQPSVSRTSPPPQAQPSQAPGNKPAVSAEPGSQRLKVPEPAQGPTPASSSLPPVKYVWNPDKFDAKDF